MRARAPQKARRHANQLLRSKSWWAATPPRCHLERACTGTEVLGASPGVRASGNVGATALLQHSARGVRSPPAARGVR